MPVIEIARAEDAADLARLARHTFSETFGHQYPPEDLAAFVARYTPDLFGRILSDPAHRLWIVREKGQAIGYAHAGPCELPHLDVTATCGELKRLYVRQDAQNGGLGTALLREALTWLAAPGRKLWVGVYAENHRAQRLYAQHGFRKVGEYEFIVGGTRDPEFIFCRDENR